METMTRIIKPDSQLHRVSCRARAWLLCLQLVTNMVSKLSCSQLLAYSVATW